MIAKLERTQRITKQGPNSKPKFSLSLHLHTFFMYASGEGYSSLSRVCAFSKASLSLSVLTDVISKLFDILLVFLHVYKQNLMTNYSEQENAKS